MSVDNPLSDNPLRPVIQERIWESYGPRGKVYRTKSYFAICPSCKIEVEGPTEKRVAYLLQSHRYWIHERGLAV